MDPVTFGGAEQEAASPESTESEHSLLPGFLKNVPDQDRAIVAKYTKDWDAGVTRKFQEIHGTYKNQLEPWQKMGYDPETVGRMIQFVDRVNTNPAAAYKALGDLLQENNPELWQELNNMSESYEGGEQESQEPEFEGLDPDVQQYMESLRSEVASLRQMYEGDKQAQAQAQQEQAQFEAFDELLDTVLQKYGIEGDDARDWVTLQIARDVPPEEAAKKYQSFITGLQDSQKRIPTAPRIIGGQGGVPSDQVDASKLRGEARRDYIANYLASQQQG